MRIDILRSQPINGVTKVRFTFDGVDAGELSVPWHAWALWVKTLIAGAAQAPVPVEVHVHGYIIKEGSAETPQTTPILAPEPTLQRAPEPPISLTGTKVKPAASYRKAASQASQLPKTVEPADKTEESFDEADAIAGFPPKA